MLPPREMQILVLLCAGKCSKQIAHELRLSLSTVEKARSRAMGYFQKNRLNAVQYIKQYLSSHSSAYLQQSFTHRQLQVIRHIVMGLQNEEIAVCMRISVSTVEKHVSAILAHAQFNNRFQIMMWGVVQGYSVDDTRLAS